MTEDERDELLIATAKAVLALNQHLPDHPPVPEYVSEPAEKLAEILNRIHD